jgi:signal transduction histidine kinase/CheY-like chemotaxis protein
MKISFRILLINFLIVVLIVGGATFAFYTIMYEVLTDYQVRDLKNSANNFMYAYRSLQAETEEELISLLRQNNENLFRNSKLQTNRIDFILQESKDRSGNISQFVIKEDIYRPDSKFSLEDFIRYNPNVLLLEFENRDGEKFYYGKSLDTETLNEISKSINSDIALIWEGLPVDVSNPTVNQNNLYSLTQAAENLKGKNNFGLYTKGTESNDLIAYVYKPTGLANLNEDVYFLIFTTFGEAAELRATLRDMFLIVCFGGIALSLIVTLLFTSRLRKQVSELSTATEQTFKGNFKHRIKIKSKDEIGKLGHAFNEMLDELDKKEKAKTEYSEFITLINRNPSLQELGEAALKKIMDIGDFAFGGLYNVDEEIQLIYSLGFDKNDRNNNHASGLFRSVLERLEPLEIFDEKVLPIVPSGLVEIKVRYLLLLPIVYNKKPVAVLELGSFNRPGEEVKDYLEKIKDQLAIGITNAKTLTQLEKLVNSLKKLNDDYHKQNIQVKQQNKKLLQLHYELTKQAEELEEQKQKALELSKVKSQFLANMSHELRTPMNSILGLTELMLEKATLDGRNKERLEVVLNSGKRLMNLINDILDLSKIESGKVEVRYEDILLEEIVNEVSTSILPLAQLKKLSFRVVKEIDTRIIISIDRDKVIQVLINLLGNAVKFTEEGDVTLKIFPMNDMLVFDVVDTGIGISEEEQKIIFEEFSQTNSSLSKRYSGTGLGLTISKKLTTILGGDLTVSSKLNEGSTFSFSIPLKQTDDDLKEHQGKVNLQVLRKNRNNPVLVIDDDKDVRYTIGQYLTSKGYEVIFAEDGLTGVKMAVERQPFAITLDRMLPGKDGLSVLKELKENSSTKDIPVILVSILEDKSSGYLLGAFEYFVKPISSEKLISAFNTLEELVEKKIKKIVIVDNDEQEFEKFKKEFASEEIRIEYIKSSEYAFNKIAEVQPDLVVVDLMMPVVDGIELSKKLKSSFQTRHIPIILSSAKELSVEEKESLQGIVESIAIKLKGRENDIVNIVKEMIEKTVAIKREQFVVDEDESLNEVLDIEEENGVPILDNTVADILIVDDDPGNLLTLKEIVLGLNCNIITARNGKECLELLETTLPDIILLDIIMPEMDGFQTIKNIKRNNKWSDIPVIAVTAKAMQEDNDIILKHGFADYIPKPVNPASVSFKVQKLISKMKAS